MYKRVTIRDIANKLGVSCATVSKALQNCDDISENTKVKIRQIAKDMGYIHNEIARSLRTNKSNVIGVLIPDNNNPFFSKILRAVEVTAKEEGYSIIVTNTNEKCEDEKLVLNMLQTLHVAGIISVPVDETNKVV